MTNFKIYANGFDMGIFEAEDERSALEAYAMDAGYQSLADMNDQLGSVAEYDVVEANNQNLKEDTMTTTTTTTTTTPQLTDRFAVIAIDADYIMGVYEGRSEDESITACLLEAGVTPDTPEWDEHAKGLRAEPVYDTPDVTLYDRDGYPCAGIEGDEYGLRIRCYDEDGDKWRPASEYIPSLLALYEEYAGYRSDADEDDTAYIEELDKNLGILRRALADVGVTPEN